MAESTSRKELYETLKSHEQIFLNTGERMAKLESGIHELHHTLANVSQSMKYLLKKSNEMRYGSNGERTEGSGNAGNRQETYTPPHLRNMGNQQGITSITYKMEFPEFNGVNPLNWIREANRFFELNPNENRKVLHAGYYMVGVADTWYTEYIEGRLDIDSECFCEKLLHYFTKFSEKQNADDRHDIDSEVIVKDGICYDCGNGTHTVQGFESHASSDLGKPYQNTYLESGDTFLQCLEDSWKKHVKSNSVGSVQGDVDGNDPNDDTCNISGDSVFANGCDQSQSGSERWNHASCIWKKGSRIKSIDDVEGFELLRWDDQQKIGKYVDDAASYALGDIAVGNLPKYLPFILDKIDNQHEKQYLLLHSLKEVIVRRSVDKAEFDDSSVERITKLLFNHCESEEDGVRNVVAECLEKIALIEPGKLVHALKERISNLAAFTRATVVIAMKYSIVERQEKIDEFLYSEISAFLMLIKDNDRHVRRAAALALNTATHNKPSLIKGLLPEILPLRYDQTVIKKELIRTVDLGPFKHTVDNGLELWKAAFECVDTLLDSCLDQVNPSSFIVPFLLSGLDDHYDVKMPCHLILSKLADKCPSAVLAVLDSLVDPLQKTINFHPKQDAVKQEEPLQESEWKSGVKRKRSGKNKPKSEVDRTVGVSSTKEIASGSSVKNFESELEIQSKSLWFLKDDIKTHVSISELREMLQVNDQNSSGSELDLRQNCADGMLFGALAKCSFCSGFLSYSSGMYRCWFKSQKVEKLEKVYPQAVESPKTEHVRNLKIAIVGLSNESVEEWKNKIVKLGWKFHSTINKVTSCLVVFGALSDHVEDIRNARWRNVPVGREAYLADCITSKRKLSFDLYRVKPIGDQSHVSTRVMGTYGYAAPEYLSTGHLTAKSDVYSFVVVLLEIISGKKTIHKNMHPEFTLLSTYMWDPGGRNSGARVSRRPLS